MPDTHNKPAPFLLVAVVTSIGQFATNIQLASFTAIAAEFGVQPYVPALTLSSYLIAFALSQLVLGTVSDTFGRKSTLCLSLVIFIVGSLTSASSANMAMLFVGRSIEGVGAGGAMVVGRAVIRDYLDGDRFIRAIALVTAIGALLPSVAPLVGGLIQQMAGWRWSMAFIAIVATIALVSVAVRLPDRRQPVRSESGGDNSSAWTDMIESREFLTWTVGSAAAMGAMYAFFAGSPSVMMGQLGISAAEFGLYPPIVASCYAVGALGVRFLSASGRNGILAIATAAMMCCGALVILAPMLYGVFDKWTILAGVSLFVCGLGGYLSISVASAMNLFSERAGTVSAVVGFAQTLGGAIGAGLVSWLGLSQPIIAFPTTMLVLASVAVVCASSAAVASKVR